MTEYKIFDFSRPNLCKKAWLIKKHRKLLFHYRDFVISILSLAIFHRQFSIGILSSAFCHLHFSILTLSPAFSHPHFLIRIFSSAFSHPHFLIRIFSSAFSHPHFSIRHRPPCGPHFTETQIFVCINKIVGVVVKLFQK